MLGIFEPDLVVLCHDDPGHLDGDFGKAVHVWAPPGEATDPGDKRAADKVWRFARSGELVPPGATLLPEDEGTRTAALTEIVARDIEVELPDRAPPLALLPEGAIAVDVPTLWLNRYNRLVEMLIRVHGPFATAVQLGGEVALENGDRLDNGWVEAIESPDPAEQWLRMSAVLPGGHEPADLRLTLTAEGARVLQLCARRRNRRAKRRPDRDRFRG